MQSLALSLVLPASLTHGRQEDPSFPQRDLPRRPDHRWSIQAPLPRAVERLGARYAIVLIGLPYSKVGGGGGLHFDTASENWLGGSALIRYHFFGNASTITP